MSMTSEEQSGIRWVWSRTGVREKPREKAVYDASLAAWDMPLMLLISSECSLA